MRLANVVPDTHTCSQVVSLYMRSGDLTEASEALTVLSSRMLQLPKPVVRSPEIDEDDDDVGSNDDNSDEDLKEALLSPQPMSLKHLLRSRRTNLCRSRWSPYQ